MRARHGALRYPCRREIGDDDGELTGSRELIDGGAAVRSAEARHAYRHPPRAPTAASRSPAITRSPADIWAADASSSNAPL